MPQPRSKTEPTCPKCRACGPIVIDQRAKLRVEQLTRYDQVAALAKNRLSNPYTHAARADGLKYRYAIDRFIQCGLPDHQRHKDGLIVVTACGLTINMGHNCGDRWVIGLSTLVEMERRTRSYDANVDAINRKPSALLLRIEGLAKEIAALNEARLGVIDYAKPISRRMREAAEGVRHRAVELDSWHAGPSGRRERHVERWEIRGWQLWTTAPRTADLETDIRLLSAEIEDERGKDPDFAEVHARLARSIGRLEGRFADVEEWIRLSAGFFGERNLEILTGHTKALVEVDGAALVVRDAGTKVHISAKGVKTGD